MHVLLVVDSLEVGGAERHVVDLARALHDQGHQIVVASASGGPLLAELETANIAVRMLRRCPVKRRVDLSYAWRLRRVLRSEAFDLVHAHLYASTAAAALAVLGSGVRFVITVHSESAWQGMGARLVSRLMYRRAAALIAVSSSIACRVTEGHRVPMNRVRVISNALYAAGPAAETNPVSSSARRPVIGVISRLQHEKGVDVFLDALARVAPRHPGLESVVIGDGPQARSLQGQVRALGLQDHVHFVGPVADARRYIPSFDLLVVPSRSEGSPLVVLEAMTAGVAVIATRVGDVSNQIRHGVDGLLVPPESPCALAETINALLTSPGWRLRLAAEGRQCVTHRFPYEVLLDQVQRVYAGIPEPLACETSRP